MGDDSAGPKVGGDRVAVGVVDGMRYHVSCGVRAGNPARGGDDGERRGESRRCRTC
jgi:hypothetical protein